MSQRRFLRKLWKLMSTAILFVASVAILTNIYIFHGINWRRRTPSTANFSKYELQPHLFEGFDNETGSNDLIVPNIVHFLRFNQSVIKFQDIICILAAYRNQNPDFVYFHTNCKNFTGYYWKVLLDVPGFSKRYKIKSVELPSNIFAQKFSVKDHYWHASDVTRIRILMQYGGIFLDNDSYLVNDVNKFRRYEMTLGYENERNLGTQVLVAHPDARFLRLWLETYRGDYHANRWYYNAGVAPSRYVLAKRPQLIHKVVRKFGVHCTCRKLFCTYWPKWREHYALHLVFNHRDVFAKNSLPLYPTWNHTVIIGCNITFCEMAREVYYGKYLIPVAKLIKRSHKNHTDHNHKKTTVPMDAKKVHKSLHKKPRSKSTSQMNVWSTTQVMSQNLEEKSNRDQQVLVAENPNFITSPSTTDIMRLLDGVEIKRIKSHRLKKKRTTLDKKAVESSTKSLHRKVSNPVLNMQIEAGVRS